MNGLAIESWPSISWIRAAIGRSAAGYDRQAPTKSALNANLKSIQPATLEAINRALVGAAQTAKVETGRKVRTDCTVVESNIHEPRDSELLWDCVRVMTRLLVRARDLLGPTRWFSGIERGAQSGGAKKSSMPRTRRIGNRRTETCSGSPGKSTGAGWALASSWGMRRSQPGPLEALAKASPADLDRFLPLTQRVMDQSRRELEGQSVPAHKKIVSIFEEHTDTFARTVVKPSTVTRSA